MAFSKKEVKPVANIQLQKSLGAQESGVITFPIFPGESPAVIKAKISMYLECFDDRVDKNNEKLIKMQEMANQRIEEMKQGGFKPKEA